MKKLNILILISFTLIGIMMVSCYDDLSTIDVNKIESVTIDTTGMTTLSVHQFTNLMVEPKLLTEGIPESYLTYEWHLNLQPSDTTLQLIGEEKNLNYEVRLKPNISGRYHNLLYTVTDIRNGLKYMMNWHLTVRNNIGEGLVIAETSDGVTTDLSHIMHPSVTPDYSEESIKHKVYFAINGHNIDGLVSQMRFTNISGSDVLLAITNESLARINTLDYTFSGLNEDLFFSPVNNFRPQALGGITQNDVFIGNGRLSAVWLAISPKFALPFDYSFEVPDHIGLNAFSNPPVVLNFYDEANGHFVYMPSFSQWGDRTMYRHPSDNGAVFNAGSLTNKSNLKAAVHNSGDFLHLLKDNTSNNVGLYVLDGGGSDYPNTIPPAPKAFYDLSVAPEIANAKHFVLMDNQRVMYYATDSKIYAMLYGATTPVFEERYTVQGDEEITTLQIYQQSGYPYSNAPYMGTNNRQLVMSTYNGSEGKVYLLPMINTGVGNIDIPNIIQFGGFDRITAIAAQK